MQTSDGLSEIRFISRDAVMQITGHTDRAAFWQFVRRNRLPYIKFSTRKFRFEEAAVRAWLDSRIVGEKTDAS